MSGTKQPARPCSTESAEQQALFVWAAYQRGQWPELALMYHIPNGGSRRRAEAGRLRAEGVKAGVPDICLPVARGGYHGLYVEMKRCAGGRVSAEQKEWIAALTAQGYIAHVCAGWGDAADKITEYLRMEEASS